MTYHSLQHRIKAMEEFCDSNEMLLDTVHCRIDLVGVVVNCVCILACACVFLWRATKSSKSDERRRSHMVVRFQEHNSRWVLLLFLLLINLCDIGDAILSAQRTGHYSVSMILPTFVTLATNFTAIVFYQKVESWSLLKPLVVLFTYWSAGVIIKAIKLTQLYGVGQGGQHLRVDISWAYIAVYLLLLLVETNLLWYQRYICKRKPKAKATQFDTSDLKYLYASASIPSKCTFWWMNSLLWGGYRHPLELQDLGRVPEDEDVRKQFDRFHGIYTTEKEKAEAKGKPLSLWWCFWKSYWSMMTLGGIFKILADLVGCIAPLAIGIIIKFVIHSQENVTNSPTGQKQFYNLTIWDFLQNGYVMAVVVLLSTLAQSTFNQSFFHIVLQEAIHVRSSIQTLVYNKCLRMSVWQSVDASGANTDVGSIVNHVSTDAFNLMMLFIMGHFVWAIPLQITILLVLLCFQLGYSALIGAASVFLLIPLQFAISKTMSKMQKKILEVTDVRLKKTSELLDGIKLLKLYAWEKIFAQDIHEVREKELKYLLRDAACWTANSFLTQASSTILTLVTFAVYSTVEAKVLTPEEVFTSLALFGQLAVPLYLFPIVAPVVINSCVSTRRLVSFLNTSEVDRSAIKHVDTDGSTVLEFEADSGSIVLHIKETKPNKQNESFRDSEYFLVDSDDDLEGDRNVAVEVKSASFAWDAVSKQPALTNINLSVPAGNLTIIVGSVGSGKTSLLSALLGEMYMLQGSIKWGRNTSVAYVPQKPWLLNASFRENILFGQMYDAVRFGRVISACALQPDVDLLPGNEEAEIGQNGVNLSGGQKQRIAIARALYSRCKTVVLDDPFSALDAQVGLHVFEEGIKRLLLRYKRTVILVTHRLQFLSQASRIIMMEHGQIKHQGVFEDIEHMNPELCSRWKATMNREEKECKQDGVGMKTAKERWQLLRLKSLSFLRSQSVVEEAPVVQPRAFAFQRQMSCDTAQPYPLHDYSDEYANMHETSLRSLTSQTMGSYEVGRSSGGSQSRVLQRMRSTVSAVTTVSHEVPEEHESQYDEKHEEEQAVKLISTEDRERGSVSTQVYLSYARASGWPFCFLVVTSALLAHAVSLGKDFWLSEWSNVSKRRSENTTDDSKAGDVYYYLSIYAVLSVLSMVLSLFTSLAGAYAGLKAARMLHYDMLQNIVHCPMRFFDTNLVGRILNRFSSDLSLLDRKLPVTIQLLLRFLLLCISAMIVNAVVSFYFIIIAIPIFILYYVIQKFFRFSSRELQRLDSITKSPIYSHFAETVSGLTTIRAFRDENRFREKLAEILNTNNLVFMLLTSANRWLGISLDYLGACVVFIATVAAITAGVAGAIPASLVGLAMAYTLLIPAYLNWVVRHTADTEMFMSGVERMKEYISYPTEDYSGQKDPPDGWPSVGEIRIENLSLRYSADLPPVLHRATLSIKAGEKVGICGRTGSGKSSLTMALFRMIDIFEGEIYVDDVDITKLPLLTLRSRLAIIPQESVLLTGTLRFNLDPKGLCNDSELWNVMDRVHLKEVLQNMPEGLDTHFNQGDAFSIGQRQLFCLARAILRQSKVVVMDEATASLDPETDRAVQKVMAEAFADCTVLTIAHRISSILHYDTIVVLDAGHIVEHGSPSDLLRKPGSIFVSLVKANK